MSATAPVEAAAASPSLGTSSHGLANILYALNADGTADVSVTGINQGTALGDCYFLSSLGEVAIQHRFGIQNMISANANGTETVTLYEDASGKAVGWNTTSFKTVQITVSNSNFISGAVNGQSGQAVWNNQQVIWPQVLENAFRAAQRRLQQHRQRRLAGAAIETLTGHAASYYAPSQMTAAVLGSDWSAGDLVVFDTPHLQQRVRHQLDLRADRRPRLHVRRPRHLRGVTYVNLLNPWGYDNPDAIPVSQLSAVFAEIDVGTYSAPTTPPSIAGAAASIATSDAAGGDPVLRRDRERDRGRHRDRHREALGGRERHALGTSTAASFTRVGRHLHDQRHGGRGHHGARRAGLHARRPPGGAGARPATTRLSLTVTDTNGTATAATNVVATAATDAMTLSGAATSASTTDLAAIKPFASVTMAEPDAGQTFTATVTLSTAANGALASSAGGSFNASDRCVDLHRQDGGRGQHGARRARLHADRAPGRTGLHGRHHAGAEDLRHRGLQRHGEREDRR